MTNCHSSDPGTTPAQADLFMAHSQAALMREPDGPYRLPDLGFELDALEPVYSAESLHFHYNKVHRAQVARANQIFRDLRELRREAKVTEWIRMHKQLDFHLAGHFLHSIFWRNIAPGDSETARPSQKLLRQVEQAFGSIDAMQERFQEAARCLGNGGWVGLVWDPEKNDLAIRFIREHQGPRAIDPMPLLVMDLWDHAFSVQRNGGLDRWTEDFWELINWADVSRNFDSAQFYQLSLSIDPGIAHG